VPHGPYRPFPSFVCYPLHLWAAGRIVVTKGAGPEEGPAPWEALRSGIAPSKASPGGGPSGGGGPRPPPPGAGPGGGAAAPRGGGWSLGSQWIFLARQGVTSLRAFLCTGLGFLCTGLGFLCTGCCFFARLLGFFAWGCVSPRTQRNGAPRAHPPQRYSRTGLRPSKTVSQLAPFRASQARITVGA